MKKFNDGDFLNYIDVAFSNYVPGSKSPQQIRAMSGTPYIEPVVELYARQKPVDTSMLNAAPGFTFLKKQASMRPVYGGDTSLLNADGDTAAQAASAIPVSTAVYNTQTWQYAKTALAILGLYVALKFVYTKWIKK